MRLRIASSLSNSWAKEPVEAVDSGRRCRTTLRELVSVNSRTGLCPTEMEIGKWRPETGAQNPPRTDRNGKNCRTETGACQPNPREDKRFSQTRKNRPGDRTAWLTRQSEANPSPRQISLRTGKFTGKLMKFSDRRHKFLNHFNDLGTFSLCAKQGIFVFEQGSKSVPAGNRTEKVKLVQRLCHIAK